MYVKKWRKYVKALCMYVCVGYSKKENMSKFKIFKG